MRISGYYQITKIIHHGGSPPCIDDLHPEVASKHVYYLNIDEAGRVQVSKGDSLPNNQSSGCSQKHLHDADASRTINVPRVLHEEYRQGKSAKKQARVCPIGQALLPSLGAP
jgi:hypothetical protein